MILVTGSAGYLGSHLCKKLNDLDLKYYSIDNFSTGKKENIHNKKSFKKIDYGSPKIIDFLLKNKIETIIHTAAFTFPNESEINRKKYYRNNILKNINFLKNCKIAKIKKIIFFSTSNVYEFNKKKIEAINENGKIKPQNYYGITKLKIENFILENFPKNFIILRIFNIAGFNKNFKFKEFKSRFRRIMPSLSSTINSDKIIKIYGTFKNKNFSYSVRDYLHIDDFSNLLIKVLISKKSKGIYNVGSNNSYSLKNVIDFFQIKIRKKINYRIQKLRRGELDYTLCNNKKIRRKFKWIPKKNISDIINSTIIWSKNKL
tara:strand:+ start:5325 stop:6275 length:951 start_codon:yes stop_codon:yes gene_type:complete